MKAKNEYIDSKLISTPFMCLVPVPYSKATSGKDIQTHLEKYPSQKPVSGSQDIHTAYNHVIEFQVNGQGSVGTLSEIAKQFQGVKDFLVYPRVGGGLLHVHLMDERFIVEERI